MKHKGIIYLSLLMGMTLQQAKAESQDNSALNEKIIKLQQQIDYLMEQQNLNKNNSLDKVTDLTQNKTSNIEKPVTADQTKIKFYGNIRVDAAYDFEDSTRSIANKTGSIPLDNSNSTSKSLNVSAATSRVGVDIVKPTSKGDLVGKLEADFMGSGGDNGNGSVRVRHAYISLGNWLIGQTTSPFVNSDTAPSLVDFTGAMGTGTQRNIQIRYQHVVDAKQKLLVALEGGDVENKNVEGGSRLPALTMRYEFKNPNLLVQLHGMLHENRAIYNANEEQTKLAWGAGLGTKYKLSENDAIVFNYYHIAGDNRYMLYSKDNDAFYFDQNRMYLSEFDSVELGYMRKWNENLRSSLSAGSLVYKDSDFSENNLNQNKRLINASVNLFWTPVEKVDLGVEYTYGKREIFSDLDGKLSRINLLGRYNF